MDLKLAGKSGLRPLRGARGASKGIGRAIAEALPAEGYA
jgi:hypothetical protein